MSRKERERERENESSFRTKVLRARFRFTGANRTAVNRAYFEGSSTLGGWRIKSK